MGHSHGVYRTALTRTSRYLQPAFPHLAISFVGRERAAAPHAGGLLSMPQPPDTSVIYLYIDQLKYVRAIMKRTAFNCFVEVTQSKRYESRTASST